MCDYQNPENFETARAKSDVCAWAWSYFISAVGLSGTLIANKVVHASFMGTERKGKEMFYVTWDPETGGVRLTQSPQGMALKVSPRPVFYEELDFLKMKKHGWSYPVCKEPLLWACERRYFYKGELVLEVHGGNIFDPPTIEPKITTLDLEPINVSLMFQRNENALFILEHEAMNFIDETFRRYSGMAAVSEKNPDIDFQKLADKQTQKTKEKHVVVKEDCDSFDIMPLSEAERLGKKPILSRKVEMFVASFSGGKDSQVVLDLVSRVIPPEDFVVIYSDTGYELPTSIALYEEVQDSYKNRYPELSFYTARNQQSVLYYWDQMGSPSNLHRWCCGVMKTAPLYLKLKEVTGLGRQPYVLSYIGTRAEESIKRAGYNKIAKDAKHNNVINVSPILEWNTTEVWLYILCNNLPTNKAYRLGLGRVGCIICPFSADWNDYLCYSTFPDTASPFIDKLSELSKKRGIKDVTDYIKSGNWKIRAGGIGDESISSITVASQNPDFKVSVGNPKENIYEWLKTLGHYQLIRNDNDSTALLKYHDITFKISFKKNKKNDSLLVTVPNIGDDLIFLSRLRRVLNKTTFCVHCGLCEVECPTGALTVFPNVKIDDKTCVKCHKCLDFTDNGCITASSIKKAEGIKHNSDKMEKSTINRYNNFGFREGWLSYFASHFETYFENNNHGLTIPNQLTPFVNYLRDSEILSNSSKEITESGRILMSSYHSKKNMVWEIIWINLAYNSEMVFWFDNNVAFSRLYSKEEIEAIMLDTLDQYSPSVRKNALGSFQNTMTTSPLGTELKLCEIRKEKSKPYFMRNPYDNLSLVATAYSIYRYAEKNDRHSLALSEFYHENQKEGIYRQFGISRDALERKLRSLQEEDNHVLSVELNMGLDNIILRDDLTSLDILKMLL